MAKMTCKSALSNEIKQTQRGMKGMHWQTSCKRKCKENLRRAESTCKRALTALKTPVSYGAALRAYGDCRDWQSDALRARN